MTADLIASTVLACLAHRAQTGNPAADEETRQAIRVAFDQGCDVELDVHLTADNVPVMQHDPTLARTLNEPGVVRDYTADEYLTFRTVHGQKPITYATALAVLAHYPHRHLTVEVWYGWWTTATMGALQTAAEDAGVADRLTLYAGDPAQVAKLHAACPDLTIGQKGIDGDVDPAVIPAYVHTVFLSLPTTRAEVKALHAQGKWVVAATSLTSRDFDSIAALGVDQVSTNETRAWERWAR